jgi:hypothetical protein
MLSCSHFPSKRRTKKRPKQKRTASSNQIRIHLKTLKFSKSVMSESWTWLGRDHFVPLGLKRRDQLAEAGAIGPESVSEYNTWFGCHIYLFLLLGLL